MGIRGQDDLVKRFARFWIHDGFRINKHSHPLHPLCIAGVLPCVHGAALDNEGAWFRIGVCHTVGKDVRERSGYEDVVVDRMGSMLFSTQSCWSRKLDEANSLQKARFLLVQSLSSLQLCL